MKSATQLAITALLVICASAAHAEDAARGRKSCIPVDGTVTTTPISCGSSAAYPILCPTGSNCIPKCFSVAGKGKAKIYGDQSLSVLTSVVAANQAEQWAMTPLGFPADNVRQDLNVFTSRASLTGKLVTGQKGTLYTEDTGVITVGVEGAPQIVGQILKIVGGTHDFTEASGIIAVAGTEVGGSAFYTGEVCVKRR